MRKESFNEHDEVYKHYKGGLYALICDATHTETEEEMVVYKDEYGNVWVRPESMFSEFIEVDEEVIPRFIKC